MRRLMSTRSVVMSSPSTTTPGRDEHVPAPVGHVFVAEVARVGVLERAPRAQEHSPAPDLLVAGEGGVEEVEEVVVERHHPLEELGVLHQPDQVVVEQLDRGHGADAARVQGGGVDVAALHQAEHLPGDPALVERLEVEVALQGVEGPHDVGDRAVAVDTGVGGLGALGQVEHARVGLPHHALAEVHPDQVLLVEVVVEHVLGGLGQVDDPLGQVGRLDPVGHLLGVHRGGGVVVAADAADPAGDHVGVAGVLALHEDAVAPEDRRRGVAAQDRALPEVDPGVDAEAADDAGDRIPGPIDDVAAAGAAGIAGVSHSGAGGGLAGPRQSGSTFIDARVTLRSARTVLP